jgi:hypothetical protein
MNYKKVTTAMYSVFFSFFVSFLFPVDVALARHACVVGAPLENCSHSAPACTDITTNLRLGVTSASVTALQSYLNAHGYLSTAPTGYFGKMTFQAVKDFQKAHSIDQTGFVGSLTRARLKQNSCTTRPVACTEETRLCSDGSSMPRNQNTCEWLPLQCKTTGAASTSLWSTWNTTASATSNTLLGGLKKILDSIGLTNFTTSTTTMTESEILQMTRNFELQYIGNQ